MVGGRLLFGIGCAAVLAACTTATPEREVRMEAPGAGTGEPLCARMARDFDLEITGGTLLSGRVFSRRFLDTLVSGRGVNFSFNVTDADPADNCRNQERGVTCDLVGPAQLFLRTPVGVAQYQLMQGDAAVVSSEGATLSCREAPAGSGA